MEVHQREEVHGTGEFCFPFLLKITENFLTPKMKTDRDIRMKTDRDMKMKTDRDIRRQTDIKTKTDTDTKIRQTET